MNKKLLVSVLLVVVALVSITGAVAAKGPNPPEGTPQNGYVHDILIAYAADALDTSVEEIETRLDAGETLAQIAYAAGVEDFYTFMQDAKSYVSEQLAGQGITIPGWSQEHGRGNAAMSAQAGLCSGTCENGLQQPQGRGFHGGR